MEQVGELLKELAQSLGTTVESLWRILLQQTEVQVQICQIWMNVGMFGFGGVGLVLLALGIIGQKRRWDETALAASYVIGASSIIIGAAVYIENYSILLTVKLNPEYWALQQILDKIN